MLNYNLKKYKKTPIILQKSTAGVESALKKVDPLISKALTVIINSPGGSPV
jgi:hypothetical protein